MIKIIIIITTTSKSESSLMSKCNVAFAVISQEKVGIVYRYYIVCDCWLDKNLL